MKGYQGRSSQLDHFSCVIPNRCLQHPFFHLGMNLLLTLTGFSHLNTPRYCYFLS